jgi:hypothetical protein
MLLKIIVVAALIGAGLAVAKEERVFEKAGFVGYCQIVRPPPGDDGEWHGCHEGLITGYPSLVKDSCTLESRRGKIEYWRCPVPLAHGRSGS